MTARLRRGQGTTELALGSLVFVTVLLFGIHFGEAGFAMLKAKEAAQFAVHDASGRRTHLFDAARVSSGNTYSPFNPGSSGPTTQARYAGWSGVLTNLSPAQVRCRADNAIDFGLKSRGLNRDTRRAFNYLDNRFEDRGGVSCNASARISLFGVPTKFADANEGGFFQAPHIKYTSITVCGAGMPTNGSCRGKLAVLTGDWAFEGPIGSEINKDVIDARVRGPNLTTDIDNTPYEAMVHNLFDLAGGRWSDARGGLPATPAQRMMDVVGGVRPNARPEWFDETAFNMSYKGERGAGVNVRTRRVAPAYNASIEYQTSGADLDNPWVNWSNRSGNIRGVPRCFLGLYGCRGYPARP